MWTRSSGLPTAPSASARYSSGIITPSKKSGALPMTTASMSAHVMPASASASTAASRTSPAIDTSPRVAWWWVWPTPTTATRSLPSWPFGHTVGSLLARQPLCHGSLDPLAHVPLLPARRPGSAAGTARWWRGPRPARRRPGRSGWPASPMRIRPAAIIGLAASAPPDGLIATPSPRPSARAAPPPGG